MSNDVADFLTGSGAKAAKFSDVGTVVKGIVTGVAIGQQRSVEDGSLLEWSDGNPRQQLVVTLQTDEALDGPDDDGLRRLFAKKPGNLLSAISAAVKDAGATAVEEGGTLAVQYTGEGERTKPAYSPPKLFKAQYVAPVAAAQSVSASDLI